MVVFGVDFSGKFLIRLLLIVWLLERVGFAVF
jgi:hypothetical protein